MYLVSFVDNTWFLTCPSRCTSSQVAVARPKASSKVRVLSFVQCSPPPSYAKLSAHCLRAGARPWRLSLCKWYHSRGKVNRYGESRWVQNGGYRGGDRQPGSSPYQIHRRGHHGVFGHDLRRYHLPC